MASTQLPVPLALDIYNVNAVEKWRKFLNAWSNYALATELGNKPQAVQVATLLTVIGEELAPVIAEPICNIMNKCFEQGRIPEDWKQANVTCILKKGKADPGNYCNILCKITESFVKDAIYKHLQSNNILTNCQHGFRCKMSCITQLLEVTVFNKTI